MAIMAYGDKAEEVQPTVPMVVEGQPPAAPENPEELLAD